jgi:glycosyltransferase involved in cell wall biosynthesis
MAFKNQKTIIVLPAYNAEKTLKKTIQEIPKKIVDDILLVDDFSKDKTVQIAQSLGLHVITHKKNKGYGANLKTCFEAAMKKKAKIIVVLHPDFQYDAKKINKLIEPIKQQKYELMLGSRMAGYREAMKGGMPRYKYLGNKFLTWIENLVMKQNLSEFHTGMRAFDTKILNKIPIKKFSNGFLFDQQILLTSIQKGYRVGEISISTRYFSDSSSVSPIQSLMYGIQTLSLLFKIKYPKYTLFDKAG